MVQTAVHHVQQSKDTPVDVLAFSETRDADPRRTLSASFTSNNNCNEFGTAPAEPTLPAANAIDHQSLPIPTDLSRPLIQRLLRCPTLLRLQTAPAPLAAIQLHDATEYALRQYSTTCDQQRTVLIYPDGSLQNHKADSSWAFVVIHHDGHIPHYQGFATGTVTESIAAQLQLDDFDSTKNNYAQ